MKDPEKTRRAKAIRLGLEFLYRTACDEVSFKEYGHDFLACFNCIASTSRDASLRAAARAMGRERARKWRAANPRVPPGADADIVADLVLGSQAADGLGVLGKSLKPQLRQAASKFVAEDYFWFDPNAEPPPADVPEDCGCGAANRRGRVRCRECRRRLWSLGRFGVWNFALIRAYTGERYGVKLGASYADVLKWRRAMLPYRGREGGRNLDFYWTVYAVTHVVYTLNDYNTRRLSPRQLPEEFEFLKQNMEEAIALEDTEMMGEFLDTLKAFGLRDAHPLIRRGVDFVLSKQNPDGSWGNPEAEDTYERYHPTYTAIDGLRNYAWRGRGLTSSRRRLIEGLSGRK